MTKIKNPNYNISEDKEETIERLQQELRNIYAKMNKYDVSHDNEFNKLNTQSINIRNRIYQLQKF